MITDSRRAVWFRSLNADGGHGLALLALLVFFTLVNSGGESWRLAWRYDRQQLLAGEWWRLFSAHLVHLGAAHALFNGAGVALLWALFARQWRATQWSCIVLLAMLAVDAGLWWRMPQVSWYMGASGVLHGVWAAGAIAQLHRGVPRSFLPLALLLLKLAVEAARAASLLLPQELPVISQAHVYGAVGGGLLPAWWRWRGWRARRPV